MANQAVFTIEFNLQIAKDVYMMRLWGPTDALTMPGQFVNIKLGGLYLRRPLSVCRWGAGWMDLIYKVVGKGTALMATFGAGVPLNVLVGLGRGFTVAPAQGLPTVLVGGGVGVPPLYSLAQALRAAGNTPTVALGFATAADVFFAREFEALGCPTLVATEDGSAGTAGYVTTLLQELPYHYYYACGPKAMLQAVHALAGAIGAAGQLSFEERMGCGFGACMGCSCHTTAGPKRVCMDGPVFSSEEVVFT